MKKKSDYIEDEASSVDEKPAKKAAKKADKKPAKKAKKPEIKPAPAKKKAATKPAKEVAKKVENLKKQVEKRNEQFEKWVDKKMQETRNVRAQEKMQAAIEKKIAQIEKKEVEIQRIMHEDAPELIPDVDGQMVEAHEMIDGLGDEQFRAALAEESRKVLQESASRHTLQFIEEQRRQGRKDRRLRFVQFCAIIAIGVLLIASFFSQ